VRLLVKRLHQDAQLPRYGRPGDAGLDLCSVEQHTLAPGERHAFATGIAVAIPSGYVGLVWDRSGLASRHGIKSLGGVIDETYRGEVKVALVNTGNTDYEVQGGDRIGQMLIQAIPTVEVVEASELDDTVRGQQGFGSSGR
jgi:dUTP pyrophosphatase